MRPSKPTSLFAFSFAVTLLGLASAYGGELTTYTGYTRPGYPDDTVAGGKIIAVADDKEKQGALGGTVYFMVFERNGDPNDPWGTKIPEFARHFRTGIDFNGAASQELDTRAKYLYLYQTVNDRRTLSPIEMTSIRLVVDLPEITSWGFFDGFGFATRVQEKEKEKDEAIKPVAFNHVLAANDKRLYQTPAPPNTIGQTLRLAPIPTLRGQKAPGEKGGIINVVWDALDPALTPDFAMLMNHSDSDQGPVFRVIWSGKNAIPKDGRSTVFGFTSNLPPRMEPVRIQTTKEASKSSGIKFAAWNRAAPKTEPLDFIRLDDDLELVQNVDNPILSAAGQAPTPTPRADQAGPPAPGFSPPPVASLGGTASVTTGGGGGAFGAPVGGLGQARTAVIGGGSGGGSGNSQGTQDQQAQQKGNTITFNATLTNQQAQAQAQVQAQSQSQQNGGGCCDSHVIPEPASLLTAALGVPFLAWVVRRRRGKLESHG